MKTTDAIRPPTPKPGTPRRRAETLFYLLLGAATLLLASAPYLYGWLRTPPGHVFTGLVYNIDDGATYLSWMRQAMEGHLTIHNRFAVEPQTDRLVNVFFWLLGTLARVTGLAPITVYHAARVVCGGLLLWAVVGLLRETLSTARGRMTAFALVCLGSGLGWLAIPPIPEQGAIDLWQPEAVTFLSLYFAPLFCAALALMVVFVTAALRWERAWTAGGGGRFGALWPAMIAGALLGNFHSYDVIPLFAVWTAFRAAADVAARRVGWRGWMGLALTGLATLPTTLYQAWVLKTDPVFFARAFVSNTLSPGIGWVLLGYGLLIPLGIAGALLPRRLERFVDPAALRLLAAWAVVGIAIAYVPVSFQRKLLMGVHLPWAILAGAGLAALASRLSGDFPKIALLTAVALTIPSNAWFLTRDVGRLQANVGSTSHRPYLTTDEAAALDWLRDHGKPSDVVLVGPDPTSHLRFPGFALMPHLSVYVPAYTSCTVYDGHWSETPDYQAKLGRTTRFFRADTDDDWRLALLRENRITYVLYVNTLGDAPLTGPDGSVLFAPAPWPRADVPPYLKPVYQNDQVTLYAVDMTGRSPL